MKVWLVNTSDPTPLEEDAARLRRTALLADALVQRSHDVTWWSADFNHFTKEHRFGLDRVVDVHPAYRIQFIHGPGYRRNRSLQRLWDHRLVARRMYRQMLASPVPAVILCSFPTVHTAFTTMKYGVDQKVPYVLDWRDDWPNVLIDILPVPLRPLGALALGYQQRMTVRAARRAAAITGHCPAFVRIGLERSGRSRTPNDRFFPFGYKEPAVDQEARAEAAGYWQNLGVTFCTEITTLCFCGHVGHVNRLGPILEAFRNVRRKQKARLVIAGDGASLEALRRQAKDIPDVHLPGWVPPGALWHLLTESSIGLVSYRNVAGFKDTLSNKMIEYLAAGLAVINGDDDSYYSRLIRDANCGVSYGNDPSRLESAMMELLTNASERELMQKQARKLFLSQYRADHVYSAFAEHLERVACSSTTYVHDPCST